MHGEETISQIERKKTWHLRRNFGSDAGYQAIDSIRNTLRYLADKAGVDKAKKLQSPQLADFLYTIAKKNAMAHSSLENIVARPHNTKQNRANVRANHP